jgi:hypothetical protein
MGGLDLSADRMSQRHLGDLGRKFVHSAANRKTKSGTRLLLGCGFSFFLAKWQYRLTRRVERNAARRRFLRVMLVRAHPKRAARDEHHVGMSFIVG